MATETWVAGALAPTPTAAFGTELNSLNSADSVLSSVQIDNSSDGDMFMDLMIQLASVTPTGTPFLGFNLWPLNEDGSTYGDGRFSTKAAGQSGQGWIGNMPAVAAAGAVVGVLATIPLLLCKFKLVVYNGLGVAFASSGNSIYYRTYNRQVS